MYAEVTDYKEKFLLGREQLIPDASFKFYSTNASIEIDKYTSNKLKDEDTLEEFKEKVIRATCRVAELLYSDENETIVSSQSHGGFSQHFVTNDEPLPVTIKKAIRSELWDTGLMELSI